MTPSLRIAALCVALIASFSLTFAVLDAVTGGEESAQQIRTTDDGNHRSTDIEPSFDDGNGAETGFSAFASSADPLALAASGGGRSIGATSAEEPVDGAASGTGGNAAVRVETNPTGSADEHASSGSSASAAPLGTRQGAGSATAGAPTAGAPTAGASTAGASDAASPATTAPPSTTAPPETTAAPTTAASTGGSSGQFESIRNRDPLFNRHADTPASRVSLDSLTESSRNDNGSNGDGNFRMSCNYSHFSYDDPIVFPGQPGKSHLHMFFGNTRTDAFSTTDSLVNSGGGSCQGFELNRSGYWTPAVLDGKGNIVVPDRIILYYKSKHPEKVSRMPQGLQMIAGDPTKSSFSAGSTLGWACGDSGTSYNKSNRIPNNCGGDPVNFHIQFPNCWDGKNLSSPDFTSHMAYVDVENPNCPSSHPVRLPQITILAYFPGGDTSGWHLSSDRHGGMNAAPGGTLHADWFGAWNDAAMDLWMNGCMKAVRNCSEGQTGTPRRFASLNGTNTYNGDNFLPMP